MAENEKETTDIAVLGGVAGTMERPKGLARGHEGTDDIGMDDVRLPRLAIAQGLSPQMTEGEGSFIEGLKMFDMFNDLTGYIYGRGPITFVVVRRDVRRIEFRPRTEGGGVVDMDVPKGDPRLEWRDTPDGRKPPLATEFVEFVVLLLRPNRAPEPIVLSIKTTNKWNKKAARDLTTFIKGAEADIYACLYMVDTKSPAKNDKGTFGVPTIKQAGFVPVDLPAGKALFDYAKKFRASLEGKNIVTDREGADGEIDDSMAANPDDDM